MGDGHQNTVQGSSPGTSYWWWLVCGINLVTISYVGHISFHGNFAEILACVVYNSKFNRMNNFWTLPFTPFLSKSFLKNLWELHNTLIAHSTYVQNPCSFGILQNLKSYHFRIHRSQVSAFRASPLWGNRANMCKNSVAIFE